MADKDANFTDKETKLLCAMIECLEGPLKINWAACAAKTGHATGASAQRQWYKIKSRKGIGETEGASPTGNKRKKSGAEDGAEVNGDDAPSPTKKGKGGKKGKQANGSTGSSDDGDEPKVKAEQDVEDGEIAV